MKTAELLKHIRPTNYKGEVKIVGIEAATEYDQYQEKPGFIPVRVLFKLPYSKLLLEHVFWAPFVTDKRDNTYRYAQGDLLTKEQELTVACIGVRRDRDQPWQNIEVHTNDLVYIEATGLHSTNTAWHARRCFVSLVSRDKKPCSPT